MYPLVITLGSFFSVFSALILEISGMSTPLDLLHQLRKAVMEAIFLGLVFNVLPDEELPDGYELCHLPKRKVIRLSGTNRIDENSKMEAVKAFAKDNGFKLELEYWGRLSGQSFSLYQWDIERSTKIAPPSGLSRLAESTYQLRNNLVIPLLATWIALALIGTAQPVMLVFGILLICFLSGACKFVFVHQMTDEADEIHLQNY